MRRIMHRLFGWEYIVFQFKCDKELIVCRAFKTASGYYFRASVYGLHRCNTDRTVSGKFEGTWLPYIVSEKFLNDTAYEWRLPITVEGGAS